MLTHRGIEAWLEYSDGRVIEHTDPKIDTNLNKVTATVTVKENAVSPSRPYFFSDSIASI